MKIFLRGQELTAIGLREEFRELSVPTRVIFPARAQPAGLSGDCGHQFFKGHQVQHAFKIIRQRDQAPSGHQMGDEGIEESDGIFRGDVIVERLWEEQGLGAIDPGTMIHA